MKYTVVLTVEKEIEAPTPDVAKEKFVQVFIQLLRETDLKESLDVTHAYE